MSEELAIYDKEKTVKDLKDVGVEVDNSIRKFRELVGVVNQASAGFARATPREVTTAMNQSAEASTRMVNVTNQLSDAERRLATVERNLAIQQSSTASTIALQTERVRVLTAAHRENAREQVRQEGLSARERQRIGNTVQLYTLVQQKMNRLQMEYRNLATAKQMGMTLTDREIARMDALEKRIQKYDQTLKAVDASMGIHRRNVGNYASGFNALNNSVAQMTREMPAFTYSVQTGFMALSNNIPIFVDALRAARAQNVALAAEGKPTVSVLKQLSAAFLGWGTLLSIGITLLTVYGKEIGIWFKEMFRASDATSILKQNTEDLNKARLEGAKSAGAEISKLETLYRVATNESLAKESRLRATNKLQSAYPSYFKNLSDEAIMVGRAKDAYLELRGAILDSARARAIGNILEQRQSDQLVKEEKERNKLNDVLEERKKLQKDINGSQTEYVKDNQGGLILKEVKNTELLARNTNIAYGLIRKIGETQKDFAKRNKMLIDEETRLENKNSVLKYEADKYGKSEKEKKPKQYGGAKLTAEQRDFIMNLEAARDIELAINEKKFIDGLVNEKEYLNNSLKANVDFFDSKIKYFKGANAKEALEEAKAELDKSKTIKEIRGKIFSIESKELETQYKMKFDLFSRQAKDLEKNDFFSDGERLNKQIELDNQMIDEASVYYNGLIELAKKASESTLELERNRDEEVGKYMDARELRYKSMFEAHQKDIAKQTEFNSTFTDLTREQQRSIILSNKKLTSTEKEYQLNVLDRNIQIEKNNLKIKELEQLKNELQLKIALAKVSGLLNPKDLQDLAALEAQIKALNNENVNIKVEIGDLDTNNLKGKLNPIKDVLLSGLEGLGLGDVADEFQALYDTILDKQATWAEKYKKALELVGAVANTLVESEKNKRIEALDEELKHSQEISEQEIGFINSRLEYLNNLDELSKEQISERSKLEDEARTLKEQQFQREKLIAIQKARAEQRAAAQQALISGLVGAAKSIPNWAQVAASVAAGALMAGLIMAKDPTPKYFVGRDKGKAEWAWTQEKGRELITDKSGNIKNIGSDNGAKMTWLDKDDKVYTASETSKLLQRMGKLPKIGTQVYQKAAMKSLISPVVVHNNSRDNSSAIVEEVSRQFERVARKYFSNDRIVKERGKIFKYTGPNNKVKIGTYDTEKAGENYDTTN